MNGVDIDRFLTRLKEFDALRDNDTVNRGELERVQPAYADEWPALNPAVRKALDDPASAVPTNTRLTHSPAWRGRRDGVANRQWLAFTAPMVHP